MSTIPTISVYKHFLTQTFHYIFSEIINSKENTLIHSVKRNFNHKKVLKSSFIEVFASSDMLQKSRKYPFVNFYQRLNKWLLNTLWYAITTTLQLSHISAYRPFKYMWF